ncbi:MAG: phosphotransferase family protein [Alphaproteobacteria bacterium]|nr:phosphotransferase family protein [Alphaproteobacteria bacterium]MBV9692111.1 phosphotransferase family protein [Alphaproteobacteria bacterium]
MSAELAEKLTLYLRRELAAPDLSVHDLSRIPGGASRETYRLRARFTRAGAAVERKLILRRDPPASLIETERSVEFRAYQAFFALGFPVPEPVALETQGIVLERPFFIMGEIEGAQAASVLAPDPYGSQREEVGRQFWTTLGRIAAVDPIALGLGDFDGAKRVENCWSHELARWEKVLDEDELEPQPIARAALRWLKRHPPPPAQKIALVHGDYRSGNFLSDAEGRIRAVLDWEMAHLGDPLEDLAWALDPLWAHHDPSRPGGMLPRAQSLALWERESGLKAEPQALFWWEVFASFKGLAIWISAAKEFASGTNPDPVNAFSGWYCLAFHNQVLAQKLGARA